MFKHSLHSQRTNKQIADIVSFLLVIAFAIVVIFPLYWVFRSALMSSTDIFANPPRFFPTDWLWSNFNLNPSTFDFWGYLGNTLTIVIPCVVLGTATALCCGYAFARLRFAGKKFLFALCVGSMLLPTMITLIPLYIAWAYLGLVDTYYPLVLPYLTGGGAFQIFLVRQFIMTLPRELDEAAIIDGCSYFRTLTSIIIPSIRPAIVVIALLIFITTWNDLLQQMIYIHSREKFTISIGLTTFMGSFKNDYSGMFAAVCLSMVPGTLVYLFGQKYFVEGIVMTGMKN